MDYLKKNYHTHTPRCGHAIGTEREYIESAIKMGLEVLGFADHSPYPYLDPNYVSSVRMSVKDSYEYTNTLKALREEYKNDIKIHIGFEVEYIPEIFDAFLGYIAQFPTDYIILGQHFNSIVTEKITYFGAEIRSKTILRNYADMVCQGIETGKFTYVAHPDLCNFHGALELYEREMSRIVETAKKNNVPLEINLLGLDSMRHYPNTVFWSLASDIGCDVVIGSDAHESIGMKPERALCYAEKVVKNNKGLHLLETVELKPIR